MWESVDRSRPLPRAAAAASLEFSSSPRTIAVVGAGGRVGCSLTAAALARELAHGRPTGLGVVLVDADRFGGGLDVLLGYEQAPGARWPDVVGAGSGVPVADVIAALPATSLSHSLLSMDRRESELDEEFVQSFIRNVRSQLTVVVDISRDWASPIAQAALTSADKVVVVMTSHVRSCASAVRFLEHLQSLDPRGHACVAALREVSYGASAASIRRALPIPVGARVPHIRRLSRLAESGIPGAVVPRALAKSSRLLLAHLVAIGA